MVPLYTVVTVHSGTGVGNREGNYVIVFNWILGNLSRIDDLGRYSVVAIQWWVILRRLSAALTTTNDKIEQPHRTRASLCNRAVHTLKSSRVIPSLVLLRQTRVNHSSCSGPTERLIALWRHQSPRYDVTSSRDHVGNAGASSADQLSCRGHETHLQQ